MPIVAWKCPGCNGAKVPLDHFATTRCGRTHVHPSYAAAVLHHDQSHYARGSGVVEVSNGFDCPRKAGIMMGDVAIDPLSSNAAIGGTAWHALMEQFPIEGYEFEKVVTGSYGLIRIQGKVDMINKSLLLWEDWKTKTCFKAAKIEKEGPEVDDTFKAGLYSHLIEQSEGWRPRVGILWYRFAAAGLKPKEFEPVGIEAVMAHKPVGNDTHTVYDLLSAVNSLYSGNLKWEDMPLVGKGMYFGAKSMCEWCPVRDVCWTQSTGAPF